MSLTIHLMRRHFIGNLFLNYNSCHSHIIEKENVNNTLTMIRPTLVRYQLDQPPHPVSLDSSSVLQDAILVLDSFFHVVVSQGEHITAWKKAGYVDMPEYANLKAMITAAEEDALNLIRDRFPIPHYVLTGQNESQARFLISKLNPSTTHISPVQSPYEQPQPGIAGQAVFTDDVSLQVFMDYLKKLAVSTIPAT